MSNLPLAVDIADVVTDATARNSAIDVSETSRRLLKDHPEAAATQGQIEQVLAEEAVQARCGRTD